jgi:hypothetical protein
MRSWLPRIACLSLLLAAACSRPDTPSREDPGTSKTALGLDRAAIRAEFAAHRQQQLERLEEYAAAGEFPHDYTTAPSLHMFRDDAGRLCAVANLVHRDGRDDLVSATVRDHNDLAVADVHDGPMLAWMLTSGLTQEELARIQAPAPMVQRAPTRPQLVARTLEVAKNTVTRAITEAQMKATIRGHVAQVEAELVAGKDHSLDIAVDRYIAWRTGAAPVG